MRITTLWGHRPKRPFMGKMARQWGKKIPNVLKNSREKERAWTWDRFLTPTRGFRKLPDQNNIHLLKYSVVTQVCIKLETFTKNFPRRNTLLIDVKREATKLETTY